jgi:hypothetical protein
VGKKKHRKAEKDEGGDYECLHLRELVRSTALGNAKESKLSLEIL